MKCKHCGHEIKENDRICLNCGSFINKDELDDDIKEEDENYDESDQEYVKELNDLLNSYGDEKHKDSDIDADYSDFNDFEESDDLEFDDNSDDYDDLKLEDSYHEDDNTEEDSDYNAQDLVTITEDTNTDEYGYLDDTIQFGSDDKDLKIIPFRLIVVIVSVVVLVIGMILVYKLLIENDGDKKAEYSTKDNKNDVVSKYSLTENPNYIKGKTWICGNAGADGNLSNDVSSYFQYDFNDNGTYAMQFLNKEDTYEDGKYAISLEDISNDQYTYKVVLTANLVGGYKTKYSFVIVTNKEGNKASYKMNSSQSVCEEMNYYNSK